jgi:hypothetical protein
MENAEYFIPGKSMIYRAIQDKCFSLQDMKWYRIFWGKYVKFEEQFGWYSESCREYELNNTILGFPL